MSIVYKANGIYEVFLYNTESDKWFSMFPAAFIYPPEFTSGHGYVMTIAQDLRMYGLKRNQQFIL